MSDLSRRDFIRAAAVGIGAIIAGKFLAACAPQQAATAPAVPIPAAPSPEQQQATPVETNYPDLVVVKGKDPASLARAAVDALGGMKRFVRKGDNVIIKPNIGPPVRDWEFAASTNPWVVGTVVRMCLEAGAGRVRVMDRPFGGTPESNYARSGIKEEVEAAGGEMEIMPRFKFVSTDIPQGRDIKKWDIYEDIFKADVLINIPIAKQHSAAKSTLVLKNMMGIIGNAQMFHLNLHQRIADLATRVKPDLTIIDAVRILVANGPTGGDMKDVRFTDTIIAGTDTVAADSYATRLFGLQPDDVRYIGIASSMGLGKADLQDLSIREISLES